MGFGLGMMISGLIIIAIESFKWEKIHRAGNNDKIGEKKVKENKN